MDYKIQFTPKNIVAQGTTVIATGNGVLHTITFNKPVATSTLVLYNNTAASGTAIASITVPASPQPVTLIYDVAFAIGLTAVMGTADMDVTIGYAQG